MSATAVPLSNTRNGYTIVTQVISPPTSTGTEQINYTVGPLQKFLKGEPKALGSVQIMIGLFTLLLGIVMIMYIPAFTVFSGIVFWGALVYISTGSLAVSTSNKLHYCVVRGALWMNVISTIIAGISITLLFLDLTIMQTFRFCNHNSGYGCSPKGLTIGIFAVLLIFSIIQFIISFILSGFACKATCSGEPSVNITVAPNQLRCPDYSSEQYPLNSINDATIYSPPMESPPPYSEIKGQEDN
ncbi:membrane-spanning 4-domains subfamily A member 12-like [Pygocentrus nattereri]|uniref:Membrane-spanning 4-domains subfamily A member 4A-like n=1 Tax=Pygocentrus nattereri TaxID=42514 RepID=A0AAR2LZH6_PYGNA|nr:membrane-spanning 4-domains subfamily A member 12-like [Pygocentrus nattereri]